jgi:hypothetical protein
LRRCGAGHLHEGGGYESQQEYSGAHGLLLVKKRTLQLTPFDEKNLATARARATRLVKARDPSAELTVVADLTNPR